MRLIHLSCSLVLFACLSQAIYAGIRPSFDLDNEAWRATDIILVSILPNNSGFEVIETWKGDLYPGARISIPELIPPPGALPAALYPRMWAEDFNPDIAQQVPAQPAGSEVALYLRRNKSGSGALGWEPANLMGSMQASAVWIDDGHLYSFIQVVNPGPSILQPMGSYSFEDLKQRTAKVVRLQLQMEAVLTVQGRDQRALLLKPYVLSDVRDARTLAFEELGKLGPAAGPAISAMLNDSAYASEAPQLIRALIKAGGRAVGDDLTRRLQSEVAFWRSAGPSLPKNWWNLDPTPNAPLRLRYSETLELIYGLQQTLTTDALVPTRQLRDLWVSRPQLNDPSGLNQMSEECDKLIALLQAN